MSTIQDVVKLAGVSTATVSRVLHDSSNVRPETREKVLVAIKSLNYRPNKLAQQFRTQKTTNILVLLPRIGDSFFSEILKGIESVANETGYHIFVANTNNQVDLETYFFDALSQKQFDGIINFSALLSAEYLNSIAEEYPVVVACRYLNDVRLPNITIDNMAASCEMTEYMLNLGHKRIAYICGDPKLPLYRSRLNGYYQALAERNIPANEKLVSIAEPDIRGGYDSTMRLLRSGERFTAIVASGDTLAVGAMRALQASHINVPDDVAVCGFDDIELSSLLSPSLTTIRQPRHQIGKRSMEKMLERIAGNSKNCAEQIILDYELIIRASSGKYIHPDGPVG